MGRKEEEVIFFGTVWTLERDVSLRMGLGVDFTLLFVPNSHCSLLPYIVLLLTTNYCYCYCYCCCLLHLCSGFSILAQNFVFYLSSRFCMLKAYLATVLASGVLVTHNNYDSKENDDLLCTLHWFGFKCMILVGHRLYNNNA